jgi:integrase
MSKVLKEAPLSTRSARGKLTSGTHWRSIDPDTHLGYRKGVRGGRWLVRWYQGEQAYSQVTLATADDAFDADGSDTLDFNQAVASARAHIASARADKLAEAAGPVLTVAAAVETYLTGRETRERSQTAGAGLKRDARSRLTKYVLGSDLASMPMHRIDETALSRWRNGIPAGLSPATVQRLVNDLKAALNLAARTNRARLPVEIIGTIRAGLRVEEATTAEARKQVLFDADVRRIIDAAWQVDREGDTARLVLVLAATGARFSQVARLTVADIQKAEGRIMVPTSRKGRGVKRTSHTAVRVGADVMAALGPVLHGRKGTEVLLQRWRSVQVKGNQWVRSGRGHWLTASELSRPWAAIIATAGIAADTVPYALRHSSIVRGLRAGLPVRLVAALHDTSSAMIEKHYAAYVVDAMDELSARAVVPLTTAPATVIPLRKDKGAQRNARG